MGCCCRDRHKRKQVRSIRGSRFAVFAEGWRHRGPREKKPRQGTRTARPAAGKISSGSGFFACLRPGQPPGATQAGGPGQKRGLGYAMPLSQRAHVRCRLHDRWVDPSTPKIIGFLRFDKKVLTLGSSCNEWKFKLDQFATISLYPFDKLFSI